ncbi:monocarboxylate transporter 9-like [Panulirus ornatus]|uniref:monocarboxylate transporter 9-like n=1 Tax=Panulirus ornatus TaxID=150431 RepID=UPI003A879971
MSEDETSSIKHINDDDVSDTSRMLLEAETNKVVCDSRIHENGMGKADGERVRQTSTGCNKESGTHRTNLNIHANNPDGDMNTRSSGRHHMQNGERGNEQAECEVAKSCDGGGTNLKDMHIFLEEKNKHLCTPPTTLEESLLVPDGGWGWLVAIGTLIVMLLNMSVASCFGILFSGFLLEKGASTTTTAWIFNSHNFVRCLTALLLRALTKEFGWRRISYIGVFMSSSAIILSAFSPSAEFLFFSYSLLSGFSVGVLSGISFMILPFYFERRLGSANTLLMAGICLGPILIAPFVRHLLDNYSYKGGALIYGALLMNGFVAVSLFHPVEWHMKPRRKTDQPPESLVPLIPQKRSSGGRQEPMNVLDVVPQHEGAKEEPDWVAVADQERVKRTRCGTNHRVSECSQDSMISNGILSGINVSGTNCTPPKTREEFKGDRCLGLIKVLWMILVRVVRTTKSDVGILRSRRVLIIALANTFIMNCFHNFLMLMPFAMEAEGHSLQDSAWCISVMGICNLATRLAVSPLSDWKKFDKRLCLMFGSVVMGSSIIVFTYVTDLVWITVALAALGISVGTTITFYTLVMVQYLGVDNMVAAFGISSVIQAFGYVITGPTTEYGLMVGLLSCMNSFWYSSLRDFDETFVKTLVIPRESS